MNISRLAGTVRAYARRSGAASRAVIVISGCGHGIHEFVQQ
jgi:hypothetical protein